MTFMNLNTLMHVHARLLVFVLVTSRCKLDVRRYTKSNPTIVRPYAYTYNTDCNLSAPIGIKMARIYKCNRERLKVPFPVGILSSQL